jgi:hypothetical protein
MKDSEKLARGYTRRELRFIIARIEQIGAAHATGALHPSTLSNSLACLHDSAKRALKYLNGGA